MKRLFILLSFIALHLSLFVSSAHAQRYVGGDISLLTKYEEHGAKYFDNNGNPCGDMLTFFKNNGHNAMRVRLFVNPANASAADKGQGVCQDLDYVIQLGKRIKEKGFALMLDFHYSDSWADPAKQFTPADWLSLSDEQLYQKIYDYTKDCLQKMNEAGATPDFIQTGNEISYGMLWGKEGGSYKKYYAGQSNNRDRFTTLLKNAIRACREECPNAKVILHTERISQATYSVNFYNDMKAAGVDYDIIGVSFYSYYHGNLAQLDATLQELEKSFPDKRIMLVEVGYYHHWQPTTIESKYDLSSIYPISDDGQNEYTKALIARLKPHGDKVAGLFWWAMEMNEYGLNWNTNRVTDEWYNAGLFDNQTGRATKALATLRTFLEGSSSIGLPYAAENTDNSRNTYNIAGQRVGAGYKGLVIKNRKKMIGK